MWQYKEKTKTQVQEYNKKKSRGASTRVEKYYEKVNRIREVKENREIYRS